MDNRLQSPWVLERVVIGGLTRLDEGVSTIGRSVTCTITVTSDYVSRVHAEFRVEPGGDDITIVDLDSTNGIFVNNILHNRAVCRLKNGDRIGIGVSVEDDQVSKDGKFPIYLIKRIPLGKENNIHKRDATLPHPVDQPDSILPSPPQREKVLAIVDTSDSEYSEGDDVDDFVQPLGRVVQNTNPDAIPVRHIISDNIQSIFGDLHPELLNKLPKETREIAQAASFCTKNSQIKVDEIAKPSTINHISQKNVSKDFITISSDEEGDSDFRKVIKSPELFDDSFCSDEAADNVEMSPKEPSRNKIPATVIIKEEFDMPLKLEIDDMIPNEEDDMYFTQKLLDDLKEDSDNESQTGYKVNEEGSLIIAPIKEEKLTQSMDDIIDLNDDDYDELLESKVTDWSFRLYSQSMSNSFNCSQVYEDDVDSVPVANTECIFIDLDEVDDDYEHIQPVDEQGHIKAEPIEVEPSIEVSVSGVSTLSTNSKQVDNESSIQRQWKQATNNKFLFSSSENEEDLEEVVCKEPTTKTRQKKDLFRKLSFTDEKTPKRARLSSISDGAEKEKVPTSNRQSSTLPKTVAKPDSSKKVRADENDEFDKLKQDDKKMDHKSEDRSTTYRRSSSSNDEVSSGRNYLSATVARRKSVGSNTIVEKEDDFERVKKSDDHHKNKMVRGPPELIAPPQLPTCRGKLRGISATKQRILNNLKAQQNSKDLKRKWVEKPSLAKKNDKEVTKAIKEDRKQKLKELADKNHMEALIKKSKASEKEKAPAKVKNVKITSVTRGAFLTTETPSTSSINNFKIPKTNPIKSVTNANSDADPKPSCSNGKSTKVVNEQKSNIDALTDFSLELLKADSITYKKPAPVVSRAQSKSIEVPVEEKKRAPPRRNSNKLSFESVDKQFLENTRLKEMQEQLAKESSIKNAPEAQKKKKKVRFNDVPQIRYIERISSATRKTDKKEPSTFADRRNIVRRRFPIVDHSDSLRSDILAWSHLWLQNQQSGINMDNFGDAVYTMPNQFTSISEYKSTIFPLLKLEYISYLERCMEHESSKSGFNIRIDNFSKYKDRELVIAKCSAPIKHSELRMDDLALIKISHGSETIQCLGYIGNINKTDSCNCITIEVVYNSIPREILKNATQISIRRIIESIRFHFGSFNAVYQLEQTQLYQPILNPLELLNLKNNSKPLIQYKGCDPLNDEQTEVLLKTYAKSIEDYPNVTLIKGPPGTGKSRLIANLAVQLLYGNEVRILDKKILICAQSNMAVDVIALKLYHMQKRLSKDTKKYEVIRFGREDKVHKGVRDITLSKLVERDHKARLQQRHSNDENRIFGENLINEIQKLEKKITALEKEHLIDVQQDELIEMRRSLSIKNSILNQTIRPEEEKQLFVKYLDNANIVCTTLSSCVKMSNFVTYFDVCIIDEATQCIEPWTIMPLKFGVKSLIMVGDTQQLPATVISQKAKDYGLSRSLFTRIQNCLDNNVNGEPSPVLTLHTQYRMHPEICKWPNSYFYKNQLINSPTTEEFKSKIKPFSILNLQYSQNVQCYNGQFANSLEAEFVTKLVMSLNQYIPNKFFSYGVITPYAQQRDMLVGMISQTGLQNVMVNTVDAFQGIEKDVIIISNARTQGLGFFANYQRLNVALTRSKKCLILCGNFKSLASVPSWSSLIANARDREVYHEILPDDALDIEKNVIQKIQIR